MKTTPSVRIREAVIGDLKQILRLEERAYRSPWTGENLRAALADSHSLNLVAVEECGGFMAGCILCLVVADELHIHKLTTSEPFRRRGIGTRMLSAALEHAVLRGARKAFLEVRAHSEAAIRLYEKQGFRRLSVRRKYYADTGDDAVVMSRELPGPGPDTQ
jgi:ribosomal-protein-alanine N-acetyltransferase